MSWPSVTIEGTGGLGRIVMASGEGRPLTPGSLLTVEAIGANRDLLRGSGIDWGSGSGCLAIAVARIDAVDAVVGIELEVSDVEIANWNAQQNGVASRVSFVQADLFAPFSDEDSSVLTRLVGATDFIVTNPPASQGDDGLGWRRRVLQGARRYLVPGAPALVQISYQYGLRRIEQLATDAGYDYEGILASTDWVPFDQRRLDLSAQLVQYAREEARGGLPYTFRGSPTEMTHMSAEDALARYRSSKESPQSKWQVHMYRKR